VAVTVGLLGDFVLRTDEQSAPVAVWRRRDAMSLVKVLALASGHRLHRERLIRPAVARPQPGRGRPAARRVRAPTLVLHARDDQRPPFDQGRLMASLISDSRFVALESDNHILLADEPAWPQFLAEVEAFLG
jgi:pimeloyl-ACP methyl ester carboxylesterase